jgi:hypothetical protein
MESHQPQLPMPSFDNAYSSKVTIKASNNSRVSNINMGSKNISASVSGKGSVSVSGSTGVITINGVSFRGNSVSINNGKVIIDGVEQPTKPTDDKKISITVQGNIDSLHIDECESFIQTGSVKELSTVSGNVKVTGDVGKVSTTSGSVEAGGNINGSVSTMSGSVDAKEIHGKVDTMSGSIRYVSR